MIFESVYIISVVLFIDIQIYIILVLIVLIINKLCDVGAGVI